MTPVFRRPETCFKYCVLACTYARLWRGREEPLAGTRTWIFLRARHPENKRVDILEKWIRIFSNFINDGFKDDILQPVGPSITVLTRRTAKADTYILWLLIIWGVASIKWNTELKFTLHLHFANVFLGFWCNSFVRSLWRSLCQKLLLRLQKELLQPVSQY